MKRLLILGSILALRIAPAMAADLAYKAPPYAPMAAMVYNWTGLYAGLNAGGGWNSSCWDMNGALLFRFNLAVAEGCINGAGAIVGGQIGYRYQFSNFMIGIEGQGDWANLTGSSTSSAVAGLTNQSKVDAIGLFTGQVGYVLLPQVLWYVKGGAAVTNNHYNGTLSTITADEANRVKFGGVIGTGIEYAIYGGLSVGVEYDHLFMGSSNTGFALTTIAPGIPTRNDNISQDIDMATIRLNYKFLAQ
jgi:outer membrane immunogenic protein